MNQDLQLTKALGMAGVVVGLVQFFAGRRVRRTFGLPIPTALVAAAGSARLASGLVVLAHPDEPGPISLRVAGNALDLLALGGALALGNRRTRPAALAATVVSIGMTALDVTAAVAMRNRQSRVAETAQRTRVKPTLDSPQMG